jgi:hypothetical protein
VKRLVCLGLLLLAAWLAPRPARADDVADATAAFAAQRYPEAIAAYERAVAGGLRHPAVFYNLANAYFRAGQVGRAVLWYERALRLEPDFGDASYNLDVARETVAARLGKDQIKGASGDPFWVTAVHWLPLPVLALLVLVLDLLLFGLLIGLRFVPTGFLRTGLGVGAVFTLVFGLAAGVLFYGRLHYLDRVNVSIVVSDEVIMRETPDPTSREMPKLHAGLRVVMLREPTGADGRPYARIQLANRVEGWVPKGSVEPIVGW